MNTRKVMSQPPNSKLAGYFKDIAALKDTSQPSWVVNPVLNLYYLFSRHVFVGNKGTTITQHFVRYGL